MMTLMLLAIAAVALTVFGRSSMELAVSAVRARGDLQRRWGSYSSRHAVLELAPILLGEAEEIAGKPVSSVYTEIQLNGQTYALTVSDEQAKVNVNTMLQQHGRDITATLVQRHFNGRMGAGEVYLPAEQKPSRVQDAGGVVEPDHRIVSLNHLLPDFDPDSFDVDDVYPVDMLTCWGDGRINFSRASDELVKEVTKPLLGAIQIGRVREALASSESMTLDEALVGIGLSEDDARAVAKRLTSESHCFSAWITLDNGKRKWQELSVLELDPGDAPNVTSGDADGAGEEGAGEFPQPGEAEDLGAVVAEDSIDPTVSMSPPVLPSTTVQDGLESTDPDQMTPRAEDGGGAYPRLYLYRW